MPEPSTEAADNAAAAEAAPPLAARPASSARSLLLSISTLYLAVDDRLWTSAAIEALALFDISEKAARQAIWRLNAEEMFETERVGRASRLTLTPRARALYEKRNLRSDRFRTVYYGSLRGEPRPPEWLLLLLSAERLTPDLKQRLRRELMWFGWGSIFPGAWLNCALAAEEPTREVLARFDLGGAVAMTQADFIAPTEVEALIARGWNLERLAERYQAYLDRFSDLTPTSDADAFRLRALLVDAWREFDSDPLLPDELLPEGWPGTSAQYLIADRYARWSTAATRWWIGACTRAEARANSLVASPTS